MPTILEDPGSDGATLIFDGVTRVARRLPGITIRVEAMRTISNPVTHRPSLGDPMP